MKRTHVRATRISVLAAVLIPVLSYQWRHLLTGLSVAGELSSKTDVHEEAKQVKKVLYTFLPLTKDKDKCPGDMQVTLGLKNGGLTGYATAFRVEVKNMG